MRARLRARWLWLHRWVGLTLGLPLAFVALLGSVLIVAKPIDRWWNNAWFHTAYEGQSPQLLEHTRQRLTSHFPGSSLTFRTPRQPGETLHVMVRGAWNGTVFLDPLTGRELGRRGEHEGFFNVVFELHSALLMEDTGKAVLAGLCLAYALLLVTGVVLWWPATWRLGLRVQLDRGLLRSLFDLHRVGGALLGAVILISMVSGAYMAWRPLSKAVTVLAGGTPVSPPAVAPAAPGMPRVSLERMLQTALGVWPGSEPGYVQVPASDRQAVRIRLRRATDPHPNGLSSVWLHPLTGEVLAVHDWTDLDPGSRAYSVMYPLHTGELGGLPHEVLNLAVGLVVSALFGTGIWLWWRRRASARRKGLADTLRAPVTGQGMS